MGFHFSKLQLHISPPLRTAGKDKDHGKDDEILSLSAVGTGTLSLSFLLTSSRQNFAIALVSITCADIYLLCVREKS